MATYDLQPEMSAPELAERVAAAIHADKPDLIILNFANPDMVGHTGVFEAAVKAVEAADAAAKVVVDGRAGGGLHRRDHRRPRQRGQDEEPRRHAATRRTRRRSSRTSSSAPGFDGPIRPGKLGDIAPTILTLMGDRRAGGDDGRRAGRLMGSGGQGAG